ncbi:MAG TPA: sigma-70 family RNA polymerase sigma factor [Bacteroidetes bacterium]|nr:sigma-70 family RNA polymerase sigma factor [Bacteroidota bacterium]
MVKYDYTNSDDQDLVLQTLDGDNRAFNEIIRRYKNMVARTVKSMLGDVQQAEDVGQDTFIRLYKNLKDFRGDAKLSTYLQRIAINQSLNEIRRSRRFLSLFYRSDDKEDIRETELSSGEEERAKDIKDYVNMAISKLDPDFRTVVVLRAIHGYSTKETAEILELPVGTVLSRLSRAKDHLKELLKDLE